MAGAAAGAPTASPAGAVPAFAARRLLFVATGALGAMFLPMWLQWLRTSYSSLEIRTVVTRSALRFVTPTSVALFAKREPLVDEWTDEVESAAPHVELADWADTIIVHPATFHFTSRFALGAADTPALLALQCTTAPIALAPALPPGGLASAAYARHTEELGRRDNVTVVRPHPGVSVTTGKPDATTAAPLPEVITAVEKLRTRMADGGR
ncbi:flavoprotein [Streptomyces varsoviensis]|uniref:flavoprotein n=1 Tax=Streptomyces varsoviensis TaxID=67373 RepID=UPI0034101B30